MTVLLPASSQAAPPSARRPALGWRLASALPLLLPAALAAFGAVAMVSLLLGQFRPVFVLPLGLLAALAAVAVTARSALAESLEYPLRRFTDVAALLYVFGWLIVNVRLASQNIAVFRDPATYALTGQYLTHHHSIPIESGADVFGNSAGLSFATNGFPALPDPGHVQPQGSHLLQLLLAVGGWLGGDSALLKVSVLLGAVGLLAVYAFGRRLAPAPLALFAVIVLSVSLPMLEFSRASYTEPLALAFTFGGFALLWLAHDSGRPGLFVVSGVVVGALAMTRIDGLFNLLAVPVYAAAVLVRARGASDPAGQRRQLWLFLVPAAVMTVLGVLDLKFLAPVYFSDLGSEVRLIMLAAVTVTVGAVLVVGAVTRWPSLARAVSGRARLLGAAAGVLLLVGMAVLASRPLWYTAHRGTGGGFANYIEFLQAARHLPIDGSRSYDELSVKWLYWYVGIPAVVLGVLGLAGLLARTVRSLEPRLVLPMTMWVTTAALYLTKVSITPDQIWGSRRLLPVVFPLVLLGMAIALGWLLGQRLWGRLAVGVLVIVVAWNTVAASDGLWGVRQGVPQLAEVQGLCRALPEDAAVVAVGSLANNYLQTIRSYCQVPAAGMSKPDPALFRQTSQAVAASGRVLYAVSTKAGQLPGVPSNAAAFSHIQAPHWNATLTTPPCCRSLDDRSLFVGVVDRDGSVRLLAPSGPQLDSDQGD